MAERDDIRREDVRREEVYREPPPPRGDAGAGNALWFIIGGVVIAALVLLFLFGDFRGTTGDPTVQIDQTETERLTAPMPEPGGPDVNVDIQTPEAPAATPEPAVPPAQPGQQ